MTAGPAAGPTSLLVAAAARQRLRGTGPYRRWAPVGVRHAVPTGEPHSLCGRPVGVQLALPFRARDAQACPVCARQAEDRH